MDAALLLAPPLLNGASVALLEIVEAVALVVDEPLARQRRLEAGLPAAGGPRHLLDLACRNQSK